MISWPSSISGEEGSPVLYVVVSALIYLGLLFLPQSLFVNVLCWGMLAGLFIAVPKWGVLFAIICYPVMSCWYLLTWSADTPFYMVDMVNIPAVKISVSSIEKQVPVFQYQILSILLIPSLICWRSANYKISNINRPIVIISLFFILWGVACSCLSEIPYKSLFGLSRFLSIILILLYILKYASNFSVLRSVMVVHSCSAVVLSLFAYYGTYFGFENIASIFADNNLKISHIQSLFNRSNSFLNETLGMLPGYGLCGKHEFSPYVAVGYFFAIYLAVTARKRWDRIFYFITCPVLLLGLYYGPSKLTILGVIVGVLLTIVIVPAARKHISFVLVFLIVTNVFALSVSSFVRPAHEQKVAGMTKQFAVINDSSEFNSLSFRGRLAIWRKSLDRAKKSYGIGIGPDALQRDLVFNSPHGHNVFVTLLTEYGIVSLLCVVALGILLIRRVGSVLLVRHRYHDGRFLALFPMTAGFIVVFFEYSFDCFVWMPHLWISATLLWITAGLMQRKCTAPR